MLEKMPPIVGRALKGVRSGLEKTVYFSSFFSTATETIALFSPVFQNEEDLPATYTEDGKKISPPLGWKDVPPEARCLILLVEDPDSPAPSPITHAIVLDMEPADGLLNEGALPAPGGEGGTGIFRLGRNSFGKSQYLPPDPPPGHGPHRYMFELYALDFVTGLDEGASRKELIEAMEGHVIAKGLITAIYERK